MPKALIFCLLTAVLLMAQDESGILILDALKNGKQVSEPVFVNGEYVGYTPFRGSILLGANIEIGDGKDREKVDVELKNNETVKHTHIMYSSNIGPRIGYKLHRGFEGGLALNWKDEAPASLAMEVNISRKAVNIPIMAHIALFSGDIYISCGNEFEINFISSEDSTLNVFLGFGYFIIKDLATDFKFYFLHKLDLGFGLSYYF